MRGNLSAGERAAKEAAGLQKAVAPCQTVVALDSRGERATSTAIAKRLAGWAEEARLPVGFLIGGADGLAPGLLDTAHWRLSFGRQTWPHLLARVMLIEQLYRAQQILAGHPYHH